MYRSAPSSSRPRALSSAALVSGLLAIATVSCGTTPTKPAGISSTTTQLHAEVSDPIGDATADARVPVSPDLVQGIVDVASGGITFKIRVAPATFTAATTRFVLDLDTDQNQLTGASGVDYYVFIFPLGGRGADVARATGGGNFTVVGTVNVVFVADGCDLTVPLALLGNDDGRLHYLVRAYSELALPSALDVMPNAGVATVQ